MFTTWGSGLRPWRTRRTCPGRGMSGITFGAPSGVGHVVVLALPTMSMVSCRYRWRRPMAPDRTPSFVRVRADPWAMIGRWTSATFPPGEDPGPRPGRVRHGAGRSTRAVLVDLRRGQVALTTSTGSPCTGGRPHRPGAHRVQRRGAPGARCWPRAGLDRRLSSGRVDVAVGVGGREQDYVALGSPSRTAAPGRHRRRAAPTVGRGEVVPVGRCPCERRAAAAVQRHGPKSLAPPAGPTD